MLTAVCLGSEDVTLQILQQIYIPFLAYGMNGAGHLSIPFEACTVSQLVQEHLWHIASECSFRCLLLKNSKEPRGVPVWMCIYHLEHLNASGLNT